MLQAISSYSVHEGIVTDSQFQPDQIHFFLKPDEISSNQLNHWAIPHIIIAGLIPIISILSGAARAVCATYHLFKSPSDYDRIGTHLFEIRKWDLAKNIVRGIVEMIPLTGLILVIHEFARKIFYAWKISRELKGKENIAGIAINGKVIITIDLDDQKDRVLQERRFETLIFLCGNHLEEHNDRTPQKLNEVFQTFLSSSEIRDHVLGGNPDSIVIPDNYPKFKQIVDKLIDEHKLDRTSSEGYKKAYKFLAAKYHPDKYKEDPTKWEVINGWWKVFSGKISNYSPSHFPKPIRAIGN